MRDRPVHRWARGARARRPRRRRASAARDFRRCSTLRAPSTIARGETVPLAEGMAALQQGDCVRKKKGKGEGDVGVVSNVAEDGKVEVCFATEDGKVKGGKWKKQNPENFEKILGRSLVAPPNGEVLPGGVQVPEAAAAAGEEAWYKAHPEAAFPPEFSGSFAGSAAGSAPVQLIRQPIVRDEEGVFRHGSSEIGDEAALRAFFQRLEHCYPSRFGQKDHPSETAAQRTQRCNAARNDCWNLLDRQLLEKLWKDRSRSSEILPITVPDFVKKGFGIDMFGNVVTWNAGPKAACAFEVVAHSSIQMLAQIQILVLMLLLVPTARAIPTPMPVG